MDPEIQELIDASRRLAARNKELEDEIEDLKSCMDWSHVEPAQRSTGLQSAPMFQEYTRQLIVTGTVVITLAVVLAIVNILTNTK